MEWEASHLTASAVTHGERDAENIYMACTALGLNTVARRMMDRDALKTKLHLSDEQMPLLNHPIGWSK